MAPGGDARPVEADRRWRAARGVRRRVSGTPPPTMAEQLEAMSRSGSALDAPGDVYGDGPVAELEQRVADLLGKPAAVFFPTGTMAQQVALRCWAQRAGTSAVAVHPFSHLEVHERDTLSTLTGLRAVWPSQAPLPPTAEQVRGLDEPFGTLMLELPLREPGFLLPTWDELVEVTTAARRRGAYVHVDGARLWETTAHFGQSLPAIAGLADSVYVSFYKTLGGLSGAALVGPRYLATEARAWRHRYGGNVFQQWPAAVTALAGLDTVLPAIGSYVEHARTVAEALGQLPGARVYPSPVHTHQFQLWLPHPADQLNEAALRLAEEELVWFAWGFQDRPPTGLAVVEITVAAPALELTAADVTEIGTALLTRLPAAPAQST